MKTIAQQLGIKEFPFTIDDKNGKRIYIENSYGEWIKQEFDSNGRRIYWENSDGWWSKKEYNSNGKEIYYENSAGEVRGKRPNPSCEGKIVEIEGKKYQLKEVK